MKKQPARPPGEWYRIVRNATTSADDAPTSADVYIYEEIGETWWGGVGAKTLADQLDGLDVDVINLRINSPGGAAYEGITIMNALRRHKARIEVTVDGLAASAASIVAMAGDHIVMNRGAQMMVHDPWGYQVGNATEMRDFAATLDKLADSLAAIYSARTGHDRTHWRDAMGGETWYTAEEAVEAGLADQWVDAPAEDAPATKNTWDLSRYGYAYSGRAQAPAPRIPTKLPVSTEPGHPHQKEDAMAYGDLKNGLRERLGVTEADAGDEVLLAALDEALAETTTTAEPLPAGAMVVDRAAFEQLQADAAQGVAARNQQATERRDQIIRDAIREGRVAPAARDTWRTQLDSNEDGTTALLNSLPKNTVPVTEVGYSLDSEMTPEDALYRAAFGAPSQEA